MPKVTWVMLLCPLLLLTACAGPEAVEPRVVEGFAYADDVGEVVSLAKTRAETGGDSFIVAGADFRVGDGPSQEGRGATCIKPGARAQPVRLGLVRVKGGQGFTGRDYVVWVQCL